MKPTTNRLVICLALAAFALALYAPALRCRFLALDDQDYVTGNGPVRAGLTLDGLVRAFCSTTSGNWHPLTMLSHMLDCQIYGLRPWGHHLTNVLLHAANTVLLFLVLARMTGAVWRSACVAALFAAHPAHVESVAWVAERKDVLSAFFCLLAVWAYVRYAEKVKNFKSWYWTTVVLFALALMSKPMAVTLPFVLLLLDFWPLGRARDLSWASWRGLVVEKCPLLALSAVCCGVTIWTQRLDQAVASATTLPISERIIHVMISYLDYLRILVFPWHLSAFYPYLHHVPVIWGVAAGAALALISWLAMTGARRRPYLAVGWLWFLGMLLPVIGLVQVGGQGWADRYLYLPSIGFFVMVVWAGAEWEARQPAVKLLVPLLGAALAVVTWGGIHYWKDTRTLYARAMQVTVNNFLAMTLVGNADEDDGKPDDAIRLYRQALACKPVYPEAHFYLGRALEGRGLKKEAMIEYGEALRERPDFNMAQIKIGLLLAREGRLDEAVAHFRAALKLNPGDAEARFDLGKALNQQQQWVEAAAVLKPLALSQPGNFNVQFQYGLALEHLGWIGDAMSRYEAALRQNPDFADALQHCAWIAATDGRPELRNGARAVEMAARACDLTGHQRPSMLLTLAAAYAETGRFGDALATVAKAGELARSQGQKDLEAQAGRLKAAFAAGRPFRN